MQGGNRQPMIIDEPICLNSKGGRGGVEGLQPSIQDKVYSTEAVSTAVTTCFMPSYLTEEDNLVMEYVNIKQATKDGYIRCKVGGIADLSYPNSKTRRGESADGG